MSMSDHELWELLSAGGPNDFDRFRHGIGGRLHEMRAQMMRMARRRAPDLEAEEVVSETVKAVLARTFDQYVNKTGGFIFNPELAPFVGYVAANMGGSWGLFGVIDTLRQRKRRKEVPCESNDVDNIVVDQGNESPDFQELLAPLTPEENLVLRLEFRVGEHDGPVLHWVRDAMIAAGFDPASITVMIQRALQAGISGSKVDQRYVAHLLGVGTRSVRNAKKRAVDKLKAKHFPQPGRPGGRRRAS